LNHANEQLAGRLKEAHEALFEVQTAVQSTPVHKRKEQRHLLSRLSDAEQVTIPITFVQYSSLLIVLAALPGLGLTTGQCSTTAGKRARVCGQTI
jgi:hypothetical protein